MSDFILLFATWRFIGSTKLPLKDGLVVFILVAFNAGLIIVDHMHFQYNGMLLGLLILCMDLAQRQQHILMAACFSTLVLMKHLFVPLAPLFAVYLWRVHCTSSRSTISALSKLSELVAVAVSFLALAFGPFLVQQNGKDQLLQIFYRLFPFGRGLVHAYWAPNVWALYCLSDKAAGFAAKMIFSEFKLSIVISSVIHACIFKILLCNFFHMTSAYVGLSSIKIYPRRLFLCRQCFRW